MARSPRKKEAEPVVKTINRLAFASIDYLICVYMLMVIVGLPFYFKEGYTYIATRKNTFFSSSSVTIAKVMAVLIPVYAGTGMALYYRENHTLLPRMTGKEIVSWIRRRFNRVDAFVGLYGLALCLSYLCTRYSDSAGWGANGWYMGFYTQMILVCSYFFISKLWTPRKMYFYLILGVSSVVFALGYLNRFSVYPIEMALSSPSYISTIGNINWYCGYVTAVFFAGAAYFWQGGGNKWWKKILLMGYIFLGFSTLVTQGSASGIAALGAGMFVMFLLSAGDEWRMLWFWVEALLLSAACLFSRGLRDLLPGQLNFEDGYMDFMITGWLPITLTIVSCIGLAGVGLLVKKKKYSKKLFSAIAVVIVTVASCCVLAVISAIVVNTLHPGSLGALSEHSFFTYSDAWGSRRGATWKAGAMCFAEQDLGHKLVGVGPDAMAAYLYSDGSEELLAVVTESFGNSRLTNAHNEWLTVLVNTGVLGLAGFGGMMISGLTVLLKKRSKGKLACACGLCLVPYTVNNIFSFQQIMNVTVIFVLLGMGMAFGREKDSGIQSKLR